MKQNNAPHLLQANVLSVTSYASNWFILFYILYLAIIFMFSPQLNENKCIAICNIVIVNVLSMFFSLAQFVLVIDCITNRIISLETGNR